MAIDLSHSWAGSQLACQSIKNFPSALEEKSQKIVRDMHQPQAVSRINLGKRTHEIFSSLIADLPNEDLFFETEIHKEIQLNDEIRGLFDLNINDVDLKFDHLAWHSEFFPHDFYRFALNPEIPNDLRGISAKIFVQSLYPKTEDPDFTLSVLNHFRMKVLAKSGSLLICIGLIEGLERVGDYENMQNLFGSHVEPAIKETVQEILAEKDNG